MFAHLIDKAEEQLAKELPFVLYRKPKSTLVQGGFQHTSELHHVKTFEENGFVFAPFKEDSPAVLMPYHTHITAEDVRHLKKEEKNELPWFLEEANKDFHIELVEKGVAEITKGSLKKVVLSRVIGVECKTNAFVLFTSLLQKYKNAFCYLWYHPKVGMWLGATPEILMRLENNRLTTMSLAGTKPYLEGEEPEWGAKEVEEQALVTKYIASVLKDKVHNLKISPLETIQAGTLWHLRTKLTAELKNKSLKNIIKVLHPTPAVCGLPKEAAKSFLVKEEKYDRLFYTGYLGELNITQENLRTTRRKNTENRAYKTIKVVTNLYVNLRCMQLVNGTAYVYVGGGITKDSIPDKEWQETVNKSKTILSIF